MMKSTLKEIQPDDFILSALKPRERLDAALKIAAEAFKSKTLTQDAIEKAVKTVRRKTHINNKKVEKITVRLNL